MYFNVSKFLEFSNYRVCSSRSPDPNYVSSQPPQGALAGMSVTIVYAVLLRFIIAVAFLAFMWNIVLTACYFMSR